MVSSFRRMKIAEEEKMASLNADVETTKKAKEEILLEEVEPKRKVDVDRILSVTSPTKHVLLKLILMLR